MSPCLPPTVRGAAVSEWRRPPVDPAEPTDSHVLWHTQAKPMLGLQRDHHPGRWAGPSWLQPHGPCPGNTPPPFRKATGPAPEEGRQARTKPDAHPLSPPQNPSNLRPRRREPHPCPLPCRRVRMLCTCPARPAGQQVPLGTQGEAAGEEPSSPVCPFPHGSSSREECRGLGPPVPSPRGLS